jgi:hypothetical protein
MPKTVGRKISMNSRLLFEHLGGNNFKLQSESSIAPGSKTVRLTVAPKRETGEFMVKVYIDGKHSEDQTYYTNDKIDAINTAKNMQQRFIANGFTLVDKHGKSSQPLTATVSRVDVNQSDLQ